MDYHNNQIDIYLSIVSMENDQVKMVTYGGHGDLYLWWLLSYSIFMV